MQEGVGRGQPHWVGEVPEQGGLWSFKQVWSLGAGRNESRATWPGAAVLLVTDEEGEKDPKCSRSNLGSSASFPKGEC